MNKTTLRSVYETHQGKVSDKWALYLEVYDNLFSGLREKEISLLEIGVQNGGSLEIWAKYFQNAKKLVGCDVDPRCGSLHYKDPRIAIVIGDSTTANTAQAIFDNENEFDLIIDDGSHTSGDVIRSFARYFPHLRDGGNYLIEDLHCSYLRSRGGGLFNRFSSIAFFKSLVDVINSQHFLQRPSQLLSEMETRYGIQLSDELLTAIHSVIFLNSICMITKRASRDNLLGERIIVGTEYQIEPLVATVKGTSAVLDVEQLHDNELNTDNRDLSWEGQLAALDQALARRGRELGGLRVALTERDTNIAALDQALAERDRVLGGLRDALAERDADIAARDHALVERDRVLGGLRDALAERDADIAAHDHALVERDRELSGLRDTLAELDANVAGLQSAVSALRASTSWRITAPLRWAKRLLGRIRYSAAGYPLHLGWRALRTRSLAPQHEWRVVRGIARENIYLLARRMFNRLPISNHFKWRLKARAVRWRFVQYLNPSLASLTPPREAIGRHENGQEISSSSALPLEFASWINTNEPSAVDWKQLTGDEFSHRPLISIIIPVYKVPSYVLAAALESIEQQSYPNWEACIAYADDADENWKLVESCAQRDHRFRAIRIECNRGISANSNEALHLATGEFIALLDHDDTIAPWALYAMVKKINETPDADFLYSDKDSISEDGRHRINPLFKPEWSPEMLYSVNYLTHFNVMRRSIVNEVGGFRPETDGAQDWDLFFRVTERSRRVARVVGILYHWRMIATSTSTGIAAKPFAVQGQLRTLKDRINRLALAASVELHHECGFRVRWDSQPWETDIVIDAERAEGSRIDDLLMALPQERVRSVIIVTSAKTTCNDYPWGAARWGNRLTILQKSLLELSFDDAPLRRVLSADVLVFVSSQIVRFGSDFLTELGGWCLGHPDIAFVSSLVLDLDERVVEAGAIVDPHLRVAPLFSGGVLRSWGWFGGALWYRNCSAASPWAVAMRRDAFEKIGGLDSGSTWQEAFVSLCLRLRADGRRGMVNPHSRVYVKSVASSVVAAASYVNDPYFHPAFTSVCPLQLASTQ
jgi:GT2 family glycosyltransferase